MSLNVFGKLFVGVAVAAVGIFTGCEIKKKKCKDIINEFDNEVEKYPPDGMVINPIAEEHAIHAKETYELCEKIQLGVCVGSVIAFNMLGVASCIWDKGYSKGFKRAENEFDTFSCAPKDKNYNFVRVDGTWDDLFNYIESNDVYFVSDYCNEPVSGILYIPEPDDWSPESTTINKNWFDRVRDEFTIYKEG